MAKKRPIVDMDNLFSSANQVYQLSESEEKIQELTAEIERLRQTPDASELETELERLRDQLVQGGGIREILVAQIEPNPDQPRQTFTAESIEGIAASLERFGQLQPAIVMEAADKFLLFDGERRWRGARQLGWKTLQVVVIPSKSELHREALLTSLHREDLNPLDKAEAILKELNENTQLEPEQIIRELGSVMRRLSKQGKLAQLTELVSTSTQTQAQGLDTLKLSENERTLLLELLKLQLNPASVSANIFPMVSLWDDLKQAMRDSGLKGFQAVALNQLSPKNLNVTSKKAANIRAKATAQVLAENLSVAKTRQRVKQILLDHQPEKPAPKSNRAIATATKTLDKLSSEILSSASPEQLEQLQQRLRDKLEEISRAISER
ncbi:ParB/RepB/Spo0J family partition protein [Laspinema palackyanum]|uniref:ParB/RepB/Spo0J family partition protein n=1 Tax=Laspinema palackyanum TaxID=3231601 RepID=UPI00345D7046|nr:ParB/RepB/Spo0J family partition protein [Laspinema sp. D2c]